MQGRLSLQTNINHGPLEGNICAFVFYDMKMASISEHNSTHILVACVRVRISIRNALFSMVLCLFGCGKIILLHQFLMQQRNIEICNEQA